MRADTRKSEVAKMMGRGDKRRGEEKREEAEACRRHRHINNTCRLPLFLFSPFVVFHDLRTYNLITGSDASNLSSPTIHSLCLSISSLPLSFLLLSASVLIGLSWSSLSTNIIMRVLQNETDFIETRIVILIGLLIVNVKTNA